MRLLLTLAWRNTWRNKRRSLLTILAVTFATLLSVVMRGMQIGTYEANTKNVVKMFTGYLQIQRAGYQKNPSLHLSFPFDEQIKTTLNNQANITALSPRIFGDGLISFRQNSLGVMILGLDPQAERAVSTFQERLNAGRFFVSDSTTDIVIGHKLLKNLNSAIGDTVVLLAQAADGSLGNMKYRIVGTIKTGSMEFDGMGVFMGFAAAQDLLGMYGRVHAVAVAMRSLDEIAPTKMKLTPALQQSNLVALSWDEVMPELKSAIQLDNIGGIVFLAILIVIVTFGILNTVLMSVTERFREFGVTLSMGMEHARLVTLVLLETAFITFVGLAIGNLLAWGVNYYIVQNPIVFGGDFAEIYDEIGWLPRLESTVRFHIFANSSLAILVISLISSLYPAYKVYKLEALKGLRST